MTTRFKAGDEVEWWRHEEQKWSDAVVVSADPEGMGYRLRDKALPEIVEVPSLMVWEKDTGSPRFLPPVVNVIDQDTQVAITFPVESATTDVGANFNVGLGFFDAASGESVLSVAVRIEVITGMPGGTEVVVSQSWTSFIPPVTDTEVSDHFKRVYRCFTQAATLAFSLGSGVGQLLREGKTVGEAIRECHRRSVRSAENGLTKAAQAFAGPFPPGHPLHGVVSAMQDGRAAIIVVEDDGSAD